MPSKRQDAGMVDLGARDAANTYLPPDVSAAPSPKNDTSVSNHVFERFKRRKIWRRFTSALFVTVLTAYLAWRFTIINPDSLALSIAYYLTECIGFILGLSVIITSWSFSHRVPPQAPANLSVDVFVPTYKEPLHIIRRTVIAARDIAYPHDTILLDDGKRDDVRTLAAELGIRYLRRPDNAFAKAGNLNYGLQRSTAEFVTVFDADHIALPQALDMMLGFFNDQDLAMVQTPQDYYNTDAFQYMNAKRRGGLWHDQSFFYNMVQPSADKVNAASCVGTGVTYRRTALDAIGGIPTETVTEDIHTSLKLHKRGYKTVYLNEPIAYGIAASDLGEYYKTRHRWGHGNLHVLRHENILFCKGLSPRQRFHYLALGLIYLEGWQQLLLFMIPVIALGTGLQPFTITIFNVAVVLLFPLLSYLMLQEIFCGFTRYWANEMFAMARWPVYIAATAGLFGKKTPFRSSSKVIQGRIKWRLMAPQMAVMVISLAAVAYAVVRLRLIGFSTGPLLNDLGGMITGGDVPSGISIHAVMAEGYSVDLVAIAGSWALYSAVRSGFFISKAFRDAKSTHDYFRFRIPVFALLGDAQQSYGCINSLSEDWVEMSANSDVWKIAVGDVIQFTAVMPAGHLPLEAIVRSVACAEGITSIAGQLAWESVAVRDRLADGLYSVDWHRELLHRNASFLTPSDVIRSCLRLQSPGKTRYSDLQAVLLQPQNNASSEFYGIIGLETCRQDAATLITFCPLRPGECYDSIVVSAGSARPMKINILEEEPTSSLIKMGLDGASASRYAVRLAACRPSISQAGRRRTSLSPAS